MAGNSKNVLVPYHVINAVTMGGSITGAATNIQYLDNVSVQLIFTGTPTGTFTIEGSLNYSENPYDHSQINAGTWTAITLPTTASASGAAGDILIDLNQLSFPWIRIKYTRSSGTGTLDAYVSAKAV